MPLNHIRAPESVPCHQIVQGRWPRTHDRSGQGDMEFSATSRRLGLVSASATAVLLAAYAVTLAVGLGGLDSPEQPIDNPQFAILEILIIVTMPAIVALMIAVHGWTPARLQTLSLTAVVFTSLLALLTTTLHFVILTLSRRPEFADEPWLPADHDLPMALGGLRRRHPRVGRLLPARDGVRGTWLRRKSPESVDSVADDPVRDAGIHGSRPAWHSTICGGGTSESPATFPSSSSW